MSEFTQNKNLIKADDEFGLNESLVKLNGNWDIIDTELGNLSLTLAGIIINVKTKGAKGDGLSTTNDSPAIQLAINEVSALGGGRVLFPPGIYRIGTPITIPANVTLEGVITGTVTIRATSSITTRMFETIGQYMSEGDSRVYHPSLKNLRIEGNNQTIQGWYVRGSYNLRIFDCVFAGFRGEELFFDQVFDSIIRDTYFYGQTSGTAGQGLVVLNYGTTDNTNEIHFDNCVWETYNVPAVKMTGSNSSPTTWINEIFFNNCKWESNTVTNHLELSYVTNIFFNNSNIAMARDIAPNSKYGIYLINSKNIYVNNFCVEYFGTGTYEQSFMGFDTGVSGVSVVNVSITGTGPKTPLWNIGATAIDYLSWHGIYLNGVDTFNACNNPGVHSNNVQGIQYLSGIDFDVRRYIRRTGTSNKGIQEQIDGNNTYNVLDYATQQILYKIGADNKIQYMSPTVPQKGTTAQRPSSPMVGQHYYDTTLGKPIWHDGTSWKDASGTIV